MTGLPDITIDRNSPVPFYFQLAEFLEQEITSGRWHRGVRVASEPELCARYGLSRTTIRQALARLEQRGLITREKGKGTFVQQGEPGLWLLQSSEGFFQDEVDRAGRVVTSQVIRAERASLPTWACNALELPLGAHGVTLERLRSVDGLVALHVINHLPEWLADAALTISNPNESLYRRLHERAGIVAHGGRRTLEAVPARRELAALLDLSPGAPVAFIESVAWDESLVPFDCYRATLRTDRTRIDVQALGSPVALTHPLAADDEGRDSDPTPRSATRR
jgi:GntR family transcriptional regulator